MRWNEGLTSEPALEQAVNEAIDSIRVGSSRSIVEWIRQHRPHVYEREAPAALEKIVCQLRNERAVDGRS
jgi:hypothetical protein